MPHSRAVKKRFLAKYAKNTKNTKNTKKSRERFLAVLGVLGEKAVLTFAPALPLRPL
jgi:hypothetical protein